jgi:Icc-related predicted phosphoesterase
MRLAYTSDLHGNLELYLALFDLAVASDAQAVVVGGDLLPHFSRLSNAVEGQSAFITRELRPLLERFRAERPGCRVWLLAGNDDWAAAIAQLGGLERDGLAVALHGRAMPLGRDAPSIAGYACVPPTPFSIKDFERPDEGSQRAASFGQAYTSLEGAIRPLGEFEFAQRPSIADELGALAELSAPSRTIYVCHTPPAETPLDLMRGGRHVGSPALRAAAHTARPYPRGAGAERPLRLPDRPDVVRQPGPRCAAPARRDA